MRKNAVYSVCLLLVIGLIVTLGVIPESRELPWVVGIAFVLSALSFAAGAVDAPMAKSRSANATSRGPSAPSKGHRPIR